MYSSIANLPDIDGVFGPYDRFAAFVPTAHEQAAPAPSIEAAGHDFAAVSWNSSSELGFRLLSARWHAAFVAHYAPDLSGVYDHDGETVNLCTQRNGVRGMGRMAAYVRSADGGFSALGVGWWDAAQGGYLGSMLYSNASGASGHILWYGHRDGHLRMRSVPFGLGAWQAGVTQRANPRQAHPSVESGVRLACNLLPPAPTHTGAAGVAPDITGHYFSCAAHSRHA